VSHYYYYFLFEVSRYFIDIDLDYITCLITWI